MSQYVTNTSDKNRKTALRWWLIGCIGLLGFENFYVGKIKNGVIRLIVGFLVLSEIAQNMSGSDAYVGIVLWAIIALPNWYRIKIGKFRDNVGNALRE